MLVETRAFPGDKALWTGQVLIGFRLDVLHSISCPVGSRDRTRGVNRKPDFRVLVTQAIHMRKESYARRNIVDVNMSLTMTVYVVWLCNEDVDCRAPQCRCSIPNSELLHKNAELGPRGQDV